MPTQLLSSKPLHKNTVAYRDRNFFCRRHSPPMRCIHLLLILFVQPQEWLKKMCIRHRSTNMSHSIFYFSFFQVNIAAGQQSRITFIHRRWTFTRVHAALPRRNDFATKTRRLFNHQTKAMVRVKTKRSVMLLWQRWWIDLESIVYIHITKLSQSDRNRDKDKGNHILLFMGREKIHHVVSFSTIHRTILSSHLSKERHVERSTAIVFDWLSIIASTTLQCNGARCEMITWLSVLSTRSLARNLSKQSFTLCLKTDRNSWLERV